MAAWLAYFSIVLIIVYVVFFATGPGSIPWFLVTELFNSSARPMATAIAVTVNWVANFIVGLGFLPIQVLQDENISAGLLSKFHDLYCRNYWVLTFLSFSRDSWPSLAGLPGKKCQRPRIRRSKRLAPCSVSSLIRNVTKNNNKQFVNHIGRTDAME